MKLFGLIGHPLGHSFSKTYFTEKFNSLQLDAEYHNFDLNDISLVKTLLCNHPGLRGFNVTIPYKEAILPYLNELDPIAQHIEAVNTVKVLPDGRLMGFNTDVIGFDHVIKSEAELHNQNNIIGLILGTGGASKAVQYVLKQNHIPYHLVSRDPKKADFTYQTLRREDLQQHLLIINTTPVGMSPKVDEAPAIPYEAIGERHILIDLIYNPEETLFLQKGKERGAHIHNGMAMLHAQAEASWTIWKNNLILQ